MTRKDYPLIAAALKRLADSADKEACATAIAYALGADNPRFEHKRFLADCGVGDDAQYADSLWRTRLNHIKETTR